MRGGWTAACEKHSKREFTASALTGASRPSLPRGERESSLSRQTGRWSGWQPALKPFDLAVMVRLVFANVEPLAVIVRRSPAKIGIDLHQPRVIALLQFRQRLL